MHNQFALIQILRKHYYKVLGKYLGVVGLVEPSNSLVLWTVWRGSDKAVSILNIGDGLKQINNIW